MSAQTEVNVKKEAELCEESPSASLRKVVKMSICPKAWIVRRDVTLLSYKIQNNQPLAEFDGFTKFGGLISQTQLLVRLKMVKWILLGSGSVARRTSTSSYMLANIIGVSGPTKIPIMQ